jgi:hypothetical protein
MPSTEGFPGRAEAGCKPRKARRPFGSTASGHPGCCLSDLSTTSLSLASGLAIEVDRSVTWIRVVSGRVRRVFEQLSPS